MTMQNTVNRVMISLSSNKNYLVEDYLKVFKTSLSLKAMPPVFKTKHESVWDAFVSNFYPSSTLDKSRATLYTVLEFLRYASDMHLQVLVKPLLHPKGSGFAPTARLTPKSVYSQLFYCDLEDRAKSVADLLRKTSLLSSLKLSRTTSQLSFGTRTRPTVLTMRMVLQPKRKTDSLDLLLPKLSGLLYTGAIPAQLKEQVVKQNTAKNKSKPAKIVTPKASVLINQASVFGWLPLSSGEHYSAWILRAQNNTLVVKLDVVLDTDIDIQGMSKAEVLKMWSKAFKSV